MEHSSSLERTSQETSDSNGVFTPEQDDKTKVEPVHSYDAFHTRSDMAGMSGIIGMHRFNFCLVVLLWCENTITLKWRPALTYSTFKENYVTESYVYKVYNRVHRSLLTQFRCGILPIKIETGRYTQIPTEYRLCIFCEENAIENEHHFLFE